MGWRFLRNGCPQGDSNPCLSLERAPSWAARRWGHETPLDPCLRCGTYQAGEIVSFQSSIVNEQGADFAWSMPTDRKRHFDLSPSSGTRDYNGCLD